MAETGLTAGNAYEAAELPKRTHMAGETRMADPPRRLTGTEPRYNSVLSVFIHNSQKSNSRILDPQEDG